MTRLLTLLIALAYAAAPIAAIAHVEAPTDCCTSPGMYCGDDCDAPGHHHHHDAAKCGTCSHSGVAAPTSVRVSLDPPRPVAAESRPAESVRLSLDVLLPSSRAPPDATC